MNAIQQHLLDSYRAVRHDLPAPPPPGTTPLRDLLRRPGTAPPPGRPPLTPPVPPGAPTP
ncbi:hypothetical protein [Streptomyces somaliensis]|uniref:hypothetical protein n=1 Tax=Streptomyces somaliensis TaxID=78355 RepID=UPI0002E852ED|nr:hypothetical protein [Streptomyces somaliensis]